MTVLEKLIKEQAQATTTNKDGSLKTTFNLPESLINYVDDLASYIEKTRQETVIHLLEAGISSIKPSLEANYAQENSTEENVHRYHILNTNRKYMYDAQENMIIQKRAMAYYGENKENIKRIHNGDIVFLYENNVGIVAFGTGNGNTIITDYKGDEGECYYQDLTNFTVLKKPLTAREIKDILGRNVVFLRTMSGMPDGNKVVEHIIKNNIK